MVNRYIARTTVRATILQPPLLLLVVVQVAIIAIIIFGVHLEYDEHSSLSATLFGRELTEGDTFLRLFLPTITGFLTSAFMFLLIIGTSALIPEMLDDPLVSVILTRPISRTRLFLSSFTGMLIAVFANLIAFALILSLVLTAKGSSTPIIAPLLGSLCFAVEFLVVAACCTLCGLVTESANATAIVGIVLYFGLGPMITTVDQSGNSLLKALSYVIPPTGRLAAGTQKLLLGTSTVFPPLLSSLIPAFGYVAAATYLFHRRDL